MVCYMIIKWGESVKEDEPNNFFSSFHMSQVLSFDAKSTPPIAHETTPHLVESFPHRHGRNTWLEHLSEKDIMPEEKQFLWQLMNTPNSIGYSPSLTCAHAELRS